MKELPSKSQSLPRRPIILRTAGPEAKTFASPPSQPPSKPETPSEGRLIVTQPNENPAPVAQPSAAPVSAPAPSPARTPFPAKTAAPPAQTRTLGAAPAQPSAEAQAEIKKLQEEVSEYRHSLQQWAAAEAEWGQQRRLLRTIIDGVSDLIVLTDHQGHRTWNNPAYSQVLGYSVEELGGTYALSEIHPDDQARTTETLTHSLEQGTPQEMECRLQKKDGGWANLHTKIIPIVNAESRVESVLLISSNITEKKQLSEALSVATAEATSAGMVEAMAQDFDQILTNVVGNLTIAKNLNGPHNAIAVRLNEIERSLQRARDLIEQMFSISPQSAPKVRVALEPAVQEAAASVLRGTMVRGEYLFPRNLPDLEVDQEAFAHAIRNIVTNSIQAMDKGVVRFSAESILQEQFSSRPDLPLKAGDYVCLHVQDQGHGISEKALPRIFEPYFTTRTGSQGLGLTTALSSIQRMGGTILVDSTPGVGTTVSVYLPAAQGPATAAATAAPAPGAAASQVGAVSRTATQPLSALSRTATQSLGVGSRPATVALPRPGHKKRILLMDDEQMILDIVSRMLGHLGYEVVTCRDGSQAIAAFNKAKIHSESFDVVMMDLVIPNGVGGQDAVHTIKKIDPQAKVIASSGHLDHPVMTDCQKFGFSAVLEKPYKLEKLQQVIEAVISMPSS